METTHFWYSIYKLRETRGWNWAVVAVYQDDKITVMKEVTRGWCPLKFVAEILGSREIHRLYKSLDATKIVK